MAWFGLVGQCSPEAPGDPVGMEDGIGPVMKRRPRWDQFQKRAAVKFCDDHAVRLMQGLLPGRGCLSGSLCSGVCHRCPLSACGLPLIQIFWGYRS